MLPLSSQRLSLALHVGTAVWLMTAEALAGQGQVAYVDAAGIYLDKGLDDGLARGLTVALSRGAVRQGQGVVERVSDSHAFAVLLPGAPHTKHGDVFTFEPVASVDENPPPASVAPPTLSDSELEHAWQTASVGPMPLVVYDGDGLGVRPYLHGHAETHATAMSRPLGAGGEPTIEQRLYLGARIDDLWVPGLGIAVRGSADLLYLEPVGEAPAGSFAILQIRRAAIEYDHPNKGLFAALGRVATRSRLPGLLDGGELGWDTRHLEISAFGGMRPDALDLRPQSSQTAFGGALSVGGDSDDKSLWIELGAMGETRATGMARQAIALDTRLALGTRFELRESATVENIDATAAASGQGGFGLADLSLRTQLELTPILALDARGRYRGGERLRADIVTMPDEWESFITHRGLGRAELGLKWDRTDEEWLRPFVLWTRSFTTDGPDRQLLGGGLAYHDDQWKGSDVFLDVVLDYGGGIAHQVDLDLDLGGPLGNSAVLLTGGLANLYDYTTESGIHTLRHLFHGDLSGSPAERLVLWASLQLAYEHALARGTYEPGLWIGGWLGVTYAL